MTSPGTPLDLEGLARELDNAAGEAFLPPGWQRIVAYLPALVVELRAARRATEENVALREALRDVAERVTPDGTPCFCDFDDATHWAFCRRARALLATSTPSEESEAGT